MNRLFLVAAISAVVLSTGCKNSGGSKGSENEPVATTAPAGNAAPSGAIMGKKYQRVAGIDYGYSEALAVDSANKMIQSYLTSVGYPQQDNNLRALVFDAAVLRSYLANPAIKSVKFMLAHQPDYIAAGNYGVNAGLNPDVITMVIVGVGNDGAYIKNSEGKVYEHFSPCPKECTRYNSSPIIQ